MYNVIRWAVSTEGSKGILALIAPCKRDITSNEWSHDTVLWKQPSFYLELKWNFPIRCMGETVINFSLFLSFSFRISVALRYVIFSKNQQTRKACNSPNYVAAIHEYGLTRLPFRTKSPLVCVDEPNPGLCGKMNFPFSARWSEHYSLFLYLFLSLFLPSSLFSLFLSLSLSINLFLSFSSLWMFAEVAFVNRRRSTADR